MIGHEFFVMQLLLSDTCGHISRQLPFIVERILPSHPTNVLLEQSALPERQNQVMATATAVLTRGHELYIDEVIPLDQECPLSLSSLQGVEFVLEA